MSVRDIPERDKVFLRELSSKLYADKKYQEVVISMDEMKQLMTVSSQDNLMFYQVYGDKEGVGYSVGGVSGDWPDRAGELRCLLTILDHQIPREWDRGCLRTIASLPSTVQRLGVIESDARERKRRAQNYDR